MEPTDAVWYAGEQYPACESVWAESTAWHDRESADAACYDGKSGYAATEQNQGNHSQTMPQGTANQQSSASAQSNPMMNQFYQQAQEKGTTIGQNPSGTPQMQNGFGNQSQQANQMPQMQGNSQASNQYSPTASLDESLPVEELVQRMTYEQATQVVITGNGKFGGKTMGQVAVESPKNLEWFAQSYSGKNHLIPAAARVLLNAAMPMAG